MSTPAEATALVSGVDGWLTDDQVHALSAAAARVGSGGSIVEIGSFQGRSTVVLAASSRPDVSVVAIDPHAGTDRGPQEISGKAAEAADDHERFLANLEAAGVAGRVRHVREFSDRAHHEVGGVIDLLFVDGAHRFGPARDDLRRWGDRVAPGGTMFVHDAYSSIGVTLALATSVLPSAEWTYRGRVGSLAEFVRERPIGRARVSSVLRQAAQVPWFVRNVVVKAALVSPFPGAARLLGHRGSTWPH